MATDSDKEITICQQCHGLPITPYVERPTVRVQVNGPGGIWPSAVLKKDDVVEMAFRKNGGAWQTLPRQYEVKDNATVPNTLVMYATFRLCEENHGGE